MRKTLTLCTFLFVNFSITISALALIMVSSAQGPSARQSFLPQSANSLALTYNSYTALPQEFSPITAEIIDKDARAQLIDNFFMQYHSPMIGLGNIIVQTADKYSLPFGLLPAIAQCEGNVGKVMPPGSFNTWGWAIYGDKVTRFSSWEDGIERVSKGLRNEYFNKGLNTPQEIMKKYTPSSDGSWSFCVSQFMSELN